MPPPYATLLFLLKTYTNVFGENIYASPLISYKYIVENRHLQTRFAEKHAPLYGFGENYRSPMKYVINGSLSLLYFLKTFVTVSFNTFTVYTYMTTICS